MKKKTSKKSVIIRSSGHNHHQENDGSANSPSVSNLDLYVLGLLDQTYGLVNPFGHLRRRNTFGQTQPKDSEH